MALETKLEQEFVSPLTAVRGALEILRDFPDLPPNERARFLATALAACSRLEDGVNQLASSVYSASQKPISTANITADGEASSEFTSRIRILEDLDVIEVDFGDFEFSSSKVVNAFYDVLDRLVQGTHCKWYFLVNYSKCSVWPQAWVAFAHRGKRISVNHSYATVRYVESEEASAQASKGGGPSTFGSRELALAHIETLRAAPTKK